MRKITLLGFSVIVFAAGVIGQLKRMQLTKQPITFKPNNRRNISSQIQKN